MSRLRIAHVVATFPPYQGGTGNVAYHNALELTHRGHDVHVFTSDLGPVGAHPPEPFPVHRLPAAFRVGNALLTVGLWPALAGFDLVHLHYPFYFGGEQVWLNRLVRHIPYIITYHQDVLLPGLGGLLITIHHTLLGAPILAGAAVVAATTLDYARHSRVAALAPERVVELPNGVDIEQFRPDMDAGALRARYELDGRPMLLFVGALDQSHYFKGLSVLLAALQEVPDAVLLVCGDGPKRPDYQAMAEAAGLAGRVCFAGRVSDAELPQHYALADVVVLPSVTRGEAFGLVLIEAMACGKPVVASALPGVRSVVDHGSNGLLVSPGDAAGLADALRALLHDPQRRAAFGQAGRRKAEANYDWRAIGDKLERLYLRALGRAEATPESTAAGSTV